MRLNLWHKSLILGILALPPALWLSHSDVSNGRNVLYGHAHDATLPTSFRLTNESSPDSLVELFESQLLHFMRKQGLRGGISVSISKGGRLVFAKGFGFSNIADSVAMQPYNVHRVASVSKLITAVAVMRLVEQGRLHLNQKVFGPMGVLNDNIYLAMKDRRMMNITVRNLLDHSGGWTTKYGDPMFMPHVVADEMGRDLPASIEDIIRFMQGKSLHFTPGAYSSYSNFGYAILGEVVAKAAGMPYEDFVCSEVLAKLGIFDAHLGFSHKEDSWSNEVTYYDPDTSYKTGDYADRTRLSTRAYGGSDIHTLGSAGGWVISTPDLVKLLLSIDGFSTVPDILTQASIDEMTDPFSRFDPIGWRKVIGDAWFRTGTLSATSAALCRRPDGICFAAVFNSSNGLGPNLAILLTNKMNELINRISIWPDYDLWHDDERWQAYKAMGSEAPKTQD